MIGLKSPRQVIAPKQSSRYGVVMGLLVSAACRFRHDAPSPRAMQSGYSVAIVPASFDNSPLAATNRLDYISAHCFASSRFA
jgi:hypothetical protein